MESASEENSNFIRHQFRGLNNPAIDVNRNEAMVANNSMI